MEIYDRGNGERTVNVVYLSVVNKDSNLVGRAFREMEELPVRIHLVCEDSEISDSSEKKFLDFLKEVRNADVMFVRLHGDEGFFRKYDRMMEVVNKKDLDYLYSGAVDESNEENRHRFRHSDESYDKLRSFMEIGGPANYSNIIRWVAREIGGADVQVGEPEMVRTQGIYHPDYPEDIDIDEYLKTLKPGRLTIGVGMHQVNWIKERRVAVDDLIHRLEELGVNVIPVFFVSSPNTFSGAWGVEKTMKTYFMRDGKVIVDSIIMTTGFSQLNLNNVSGEKVGTNFFKDLNVPVIQAPGISRTVEDWREDVIGMTSTEIGSCVIWPEYDGQIISVPNGFTYRDEDGVFRTRSLPDRIDRIATLGIMWAELNNKPAKDRRIAFLFNMYPPTNDHVGGAAGLDSPESVRQCLIAMKEKGYTVDYIPEDGNAIVFKLIDGVTSDLEWTPVEEIPDRAMDMMDVDTYNREWYSKLTQKARDGIEHGWGKPPGEISVLEDKFIIPGYTDGNVFIGIQPNRGQHEKAEMLYHDPFVVMPHQYVAFYRWLKYVFKADCIIHMGTHGTLEWLPGKGNALSEDCYPDVVLDTMPNVYPYIIDDPGEGVQCKRRANSVLIGHMCPAMTRAGNYDELMDLEGYLQEYLNSRSTMQDAKRDSLDANIREQIERLDMFKELGLEPDCTEEDVDEIIDKIYDYVADLKDAMIKDGLHILGKVPEEERMKEMVYSLCRLRNGEIPSLRGCVCSMMGHDLDFLLDNFSKMNEKAGKVNGSVLDDVDSNFNLLIDRMYDVSFDRERSLEAAEGILGTLDEPTRTSVSYVCDVIYPGVLGIGEEMDNFLVGIEGRFVLPGPSGSPTRGNAHLLPTGRNFYSIDPDAIPSEASWRVGKKMADDMIQRYIDDNGKYPENIGIVVWATDTMKTYGDDVAYILSLLGIRPTWGTVGGKVSGLKVIPLEELGRPRIDVMPRITGLFRDSFPNLADMMVEALEMIAELDESDEDNYYKKHLQEDIQKYINDGMKPSDAKDLASIRVFGDPPGQHGNGVSVLIASSKWDTLDQIGETYATWGAHAYGGKWKGQKVPEAFKRRVGALDVTVKNHNDREFDMLDIDDDYDSLGGMNAAVRTFGGHMPYSVMGDSSDVDRLKTRTLDEETAYVMRSRVLNPKWAEGLKQHGYKGAMELSKLTEYMLGWSATSDNIEPWMFKQVTEKYILDEDMRDWVNENNPFAMKEMIEDMLEAIDRDLWDADPEMREQLRDLYLEAEGLLEDYSTNNKE